MKNMLILSAALFLGGCLSVVRIPMCNEKVSEEKGRSVTVTDTGKPYECATTNEYDNIYSLVWDEERIRRAAEFYQNFDKKAIENPYADETVELSPYSLFPDGGKLIDAFDAKYSCKCSEIGAPK